MRLFNRCWLSVSDIFLTQKVVTRFLKSYLEQYQTKMTDCIKDPHTTMLEKMNLF